MKKNELTKDICQNRKAHHSFFIDKKFEAGISLLGSEVKSLREGRAHLSDAFVHIRDGRPILQNAHISPYGNATHVQHEAMRERYLLLNKAEVKRIEKEIKVKGNSVVPLRMYFKGPYVKVEIALAKGKKDYDKREDIKTRMAEREMGREGKRQR